jgi:hypothetical protein
METFSTGIGIFAFIVGLIWLFFPVAVINFLVSKERPIVPLCSIWRHWISIAPRLEAIDRELQEMLKRIDSGE